MSGHSEKLRPVAFMVMPFRKRLVPSAPAGAPLQIDCDALWDRAFRPALEALGYLAIRADSELGTVIVKDMFERLALAELVLADLTLPNGNVYYEVGLRHAVKRTHCVLLAADWSAQLFDVEQIRTERYPLKDGAVPPEEAERIRDFLIRIIPEKKHSKTPFHELVNTKKESTVFRRQLEKISQFQAEVRALRMSADLNHRSARVTELCTHYHGADLDLPEVAFELLTLVRDSLGWEALIDYIENLPDTFKQQPFTQEQLLLAKSQVGDHYIAIERLKELVKQQGESAERSGLLGGRYKRLWREARQAREDPKPGLEEQGFLDAAIEHYMHGTELDLNAYFCPSNLPGLLLARGCTGDEEEAHFLDLLTVRACERSIKKSDDDIWARLTLLLMAFRRGDIDRVRQLCRDVAGRGAAPWQIKSTLDDIDETIIAIKDPMTKSALGDLRNQLAKLSEQAQVVPGETA